MRGRGPVNTFSPARGNNGAGGYSPRDQDGEDSFEHINIESNLVGLIIGRSGENLRRIEAETGCRVQFITGPDDSGPYRQCKITGNKARRAATKAELNRIIDESGMSASARQGGGSNDRRPPIREVQPPPSRGAPPASAHQPALRDGEDSMQIMVPDRTVGLIIGRGGETIRDLQERSGCHVNIVGEQKSVNGLRPVNLIGTREAAARAKDMIMEIVESDSKAKVPEPRGPPQREPAGRDSYGAGAYGGGGGGAGGDKSSDSIFVPSDAVGMIIGKGGETIKDMQSTTSCKINVSPSSGPHETEREIGLVGSRDAINAAKRAIEDKVEAVVSAFPYLDYHVLTQYSKTRTAWVVETAAVEMVVDAVLKMTMAIVTTLSNNRPTPSLSRRRRLQVLLLLQMRLTLMLNVSLLMPPIPGLIVY